MQTEERRACPSCGAENAQGAGFCWQCYTPFAPVAAASRPGAAAMPSAPGWGPAGSPAPPVPVASPRGAGGGGRIVRIVLGVVVALIVGAVVRQQLAPDYHVPDAVAGQPRMQNVFAKNFEQQMVEEGKKYDVDLEAAVYGTTETPDMFVIVANGRAEENSNELFDSFLEGVDSSGLHVDRAGQLTGERGDAEYRCVPLSAGTHQAAACLWREDASVGITFDLSPEGDVTAAFAAAYDAVHA